MKLIRLEILGFKSFRERTGFDFSAGINAVVGPNGCGKSNIVDALRFALGEQRIRSLRGKTMDDLLFGGSEEAQPVGVAEVSLVLARGKNSFPGKLDHLEEVMVTRRLTRGGESEYFLNKVRCRHLDIKEFFAGTGLGSKSYCLIEQNSVNLLLEARPEEIRLFIDEAAGISKYKGRRESALRKLLTTRQDITRLSDITGEVKNRVVTLGKQANKAKQFKELRHEIRKMEELLTWYVFTDFRRQEEENKRELQQIKDDEQKIKAQSGLLAAAYEETLLAVEELRHHQLRLQEEYHQLAGSLAMKEQGQRFTRTRIKELTERQGKLSEELKSVAAIREENEGEFDELAKQQETLGKEISQLTEILAGREKELALFKAKAKERLKQSEERRLLSFNLARDRAKDENQLLSWEKNLADLAKRQINREREEGEQRERQKGLQERGTALQEQLRQDSAALADLREERQRGEEEWARLTAQVNQAEETLAELKVSLGINVTRLKSIKEFQEGYAFLNEGAKAVMMLAQEDQREEETGFHPRGIVADYLEVPRELESALEAALGEKLRYVAVADGDEALAAIEYLKRRGAGRGSFVPLDQPAIPGKEKIKGIGNGKRLMEMVTCQGDFQKTGELLMGDVLLVENLREGWQLHQNGYAHCSILTVDGDLISPDGVLSGGFQGNGKMGLLQNRREMAEIEAKLQEIDRQRKHWTDEHQLFLKRRDAWWQEIGRVRAREHSLELAMNGRRKDLERLQDEARRVKQRLEGLSSLKRQLEAEIAEGNLQCAKLREEGDRKKVQEEAWNRELKSLLEVREEEGRKEAEKEKAFLTDKVHLASLTEKLAATIKARQRLAANLQTATCRERDLQKEIQDCRHSCRELQEEVNRGEDFLRTLTLNLEEARSNLAGLEEKNQVAQQNLKKQEKDLEEIKVILRETGKDITTREKILTEVTCEMAHLREKVLATYDLDLLAWQPDETQEGLDPHLLKSELEAKKVQLERFGEVNLLALTEHEELEKRYAFLTAQMEDLKKAVESLNRTINGINRVCRRRFKEAFAGINTRFQEVFRVMFSGGKGELFLTDEENLLETGVDMDIQIPGKRLTGLALLSGGEKTLAAIALIFAIMKYHPAPFLVVDEVDAALDDANVILLNRLIRELARESQIIMVTHNKLSMEGADSLFGVTMQKKGVSSLVSVTLN